MSYFNIVAATSENTVVTEYEPVKKRSDAYQSEAATSGTRPAAARRSHHLRRQDWLLSCLL
jgi:hypothetical protein